MPAPDRLLPFLQWPTSDDRPDAAVVARECRSAEPLGGTIDDDDTDDDDAFSRFVSARLDEDGYVLLKGVLSAAECEVEMRRLWDFVEAVAPGVKRDDRESWYPPPAAAAACVKVEGGGPGGGGPRGTSVKVAEEDPWPASQWSSFTDMIQMHEAGWVFARLKELLAERVFARLFRTTALHCSKVRG